MSIYLNINAALREQLVFVSVSLAAFLATPAIVQAQVPNGVSFFTEPLSLSRGKISPGSQKGRIINRNKYCDIVKVEWGWESCDGIDAFVVSYNQDVDTLIVTKPNSEGRVSFDDWKSGNLTDEIKEIEKSVRQSLSEQGRRLNKKIEFAGWRLYPTLDENKKILFYAFDVNWGNEVSTNIKATFFDRFGYATFMIVPESSGLARSKLETVVRDTLAGYTPNAMQSYSEFRTGDKVAAAGAVGVLATLLGVKYGKVAAAGLFAVALVFLKKLWLLLCLPFIALVRLFRRSPKADKSVQS